MLKNFDFTLLKEVVIQGEMDKEIAKIHVLEKIIRLGKGFARIRLVPVFFEADNFLQSQSRALSSFH